MTKQRCEEFFDNDDNIALGEMDIEGMLAWAAEKMGIPYLGLLAHKESIVEAKRRLGGSGDQAALNKSMGNGNFCLMSRSKFDTEQLMQVSHDIPCDSGTANLFPKDLKLVSAP